jgi:hypothetical protein
MKKIYRAVVEITDPNDEPYTRTQIALMIEDSSYHARMASVEVKCIELTEVKE